MKGCNYNDLDICGSNASVNSSCAQHKIYKWSTPGTDKAGKCPAVGRGGGGRWAHRELTDTRGRLLSYKKFKESRVKANEHWSNSLSPYPFFLFIRCRFVKVELKLEPYDKQAKGNVIWWSATPRNHPAFSPNSRTELLYTQAKKPEKLLTITSSRCLYTRSTLNLTNQPPHLNNNDKKTFMIISTCIISPISKNIRITQNMSDKGCCRLISIRLPSFSCWFRTSCEIWYPFYNEPLEFIVKCGCINAWKKKGFDD